MADEIVPIKGYAASLNLGKRGFLDCYEVPSGEKRVGFEGAATSLGHTPDWVGRLAVKGKKLLKALEGEGWNGSAIPVSAEVRGFKTIAKTLSVRDYIKLVGQDALIGKNPAAISLLIAFAEVGVEKAIDDLFSGHNTEYLLQKIKHFEDWTYSDYMTALESNREDLEALIARW